MKTMTKIREYMNESFTEDGDDLKIGNEDDRLGVLDSLQILRMVMDLETHYGIKLENSEMTPENLGTVARLSVFIDRKC